RQSPGGERTMIQRMTERDRLLDLYARARGEERIKILARLVVLDEEEKYAKRSNGRSTNP
ncbi:MAG: hypothetical protein K6T85_01515, partial [Gorillibacterium sp.]|nr:hypothetical protein [Gorillibacterium sp.]